MAEKNVKQRMRDGEVIMCGKMALASDLSDVRATLEAGGIDLLQCDSQHVPFNEERLIPYCNLAEEYNVPVLFRIKNTRLTYQIGNWADLGPTGFEVPQVETETMVDEALDALYYPPVGKRSWGPAHGFGFTPDRERVEYAKWWNETCILLLQVESVNAVANARKFAKAGVDCISFGPADLTINLRTYPHHPLSLPSSAHHLLSDEIVRHVGDQLKGSGVSICLRGIAPEDRDRYIDMGVNVFL